MIVGLGIDTVDIDRFEDWHKKPKEQLQKIFSDDEISYCLSKQQSAQHFAVRFAAREAFFKAWQSMLRHHNSQHEANLFMMNKLISIKHTAQGLPIIQAEWSSLLDEHIPEPTVHISLTHTQQQATAIVILQQVNR